MSIVYVIYWTGTIAYFVYAVIKLNIKRREAQNIMIDHNIGYAQLYVITAMLSFFWFIFAPASIFMKGSK